MTALRDTEVERELLSVLLQLGTLDGPGKTKTTVEALGLEPGDFADHSHECVYRAAKALLDCGKAPDVLSLRSELSNVPGANTDVQWLSALSEASFGGEASLKGYADRIRDLSFRRRSIAILRQGAAGLSDEKARAEDAAQLVVSELSKLASRRSSIRDLGDILQGVLTELEEIAAGRDPVLPTGIEQLDRVIGGLQPTLTILGALPGVGKSALLATVANNLARAGKRVGVFSLEDPAEWIGYRLLAHGSQVSQFTMSNRRLSDSQMQRIAAAAEDMWRFRGNVLVDDRSRLSASEIVATARHMVINLGAQAIFVDHLGEVQANARRDRYDLDVMDALSELRSIAKTHKTPVWVAVHLARRADDAEREVKLSDFANSAAVERQARVALGMTRKHGTEDLCISVLKQTKGVAGVKVHLEFAGRSSMVRNDGGSVEGNHGVDDSQGD